MTMPTASITCANYDNNGANLVGTPVRTKPVFSIVN